MRDLVTWTVQDTPPELVVTRVLGTWVNTAWVVGTLGAAATGAAPRPDWSVPSDPNAYVGIGLVTLRGSAAWSPPGASDSRPRLTANQFDAWVTSRRDDRPDTQVPLQHLRVTAATTHSRSRAPKHPDAPWTLTVADRNEQVQIDGAWLALAWIGLLAGWPEPA